MYHLIYKGLYTHESPGNFFDAHGYAMYLSEIVGFMLKTYGTGSIRYWNKRMQPKWAPMMHKAEVVVIDGMSYHLYIDGMYRKAPDFRSMGYYSDCSAYKTIKQIKRYGIKHGNWTMLFLNTHKRNSDYFKLGFELNSLTSMGAAVLCVRDNISVHFKIAHNKSHLWVPL